MKRWRNWVIAMVITMPLSYFWYDTLVMLAIYGFCFGLCVRLLVNLVLPEDES